MRHHDLEVTTQWYFSSGIVLIQDHNRELLRGLNGRGDL
jgi:hypothetical protein